MVQVLLYSSFLKVYERESDPTKHDVLCPKLWTKREKDGKVVWEFDQRVRRKLVRLAKEFYNKYKHILKEKDLIDIQLTGSLANFNYTDLSDLDIHVIVNMDGAEEDSPELFKSLLNGAKFNWDMGKGVKIRGHQVELHFQDDNDQHSSSGLYSLLKDEWETPPSHEILEIDQRDVKKKFESIVYEMDQIKNRIQGESTPSNIDALYKRLVSLKEKIQRMRKEPLSKGGDSSIGAMVFKKLRNGGYIEKLVDLVSEAYDKIHNKD